MRRVSCFNEEVKKLSPPENGESKKNGVDRTQKAMISLLPHHPKTKAAAKSEEKPVTEFRTVYERFRSDLLTAMTGQNRRRRHEMCSLFQNLEGVIRIIEPQRVRYRVIMAFNILKNHHGTVNQTEREQAMAGLFPNEDAFKEETLAMIGEYVSRIRSLTGMKQLHEAVAHAWTQVKGNPAAVEDPVVIGNCEKRPNTEPMEECFSKVFRSISSSLGVSSSLFNDLSPEERSCTPVEIQWSQREIELAQMEAAQVTVASSSSSSSLQQQIFAEPEPTPSSSHGGLTCADIVTTLATFFPDSHEPMVKHLFELLKSDRSSDDLQGELFDLLGYEQFEMIGRILEARHALNDEMSGVKKEASKLSKFAPDKLVPLRNDGAIYCQQVTVQSQAQAQARKEMRKEQKRVKKELSRIQHAFGEEEKLEMELAQREMLRQRQLELDQLKWTPSLQSAAGISEVYPFVFDSRVQATQALVTIKGMKYALPEGSKTENHRTFESVEVPPANRQSVQDIQHVYIKDMDELGQLGFKGFEKLNTIQSIVFEQAYKTKENLLICAPTGAGKTNIAMLTILNTIHEHTKPNGEIAKDDFKIIYIAPMKALATEMTTSFGKRLAPLGLQVRELTGDTQLSKKEVSETQMLILTPEKWDVVTRKGAADNSLTSLVRLLIIDEVHLLHDDRGPVIETIVARTLRQVEMSQSGIRIVGLSATLPNYVDVARFLRVNPYKGLFFFDGRFRPVPLTQKFIGVKKIGGIREVQTNMDEICYDEVLSYVKRGHQVLVFVHARSATARLAQAFRERAAQLGHLEMFVPQTLGGRGYVSAEKSIQASRNGQLYEFFRFGYGIHHAGLQRSDRLLMEKTFAQGHISVLFCTATLAWGVNLPAHAVVIRGTDVFDAEKGAFADLGVLDVQQIFGRAGRPQFENEGHGIIITNSDKLHKYLEMLNRQAPIESQFFKRLNDNLNAEVALGTVSTIDEAVEWLTYTYYYTRALKNPMAYAMPHNICEVDPDLRNHLAKMITEVAVKLDQNEMIRFEPGNGFLNATDLGRIASNFYVKFETIEQLKETGVPVQLTPLMPDDMVLALIASATEFSNLKVREEEALDLEELRNYGCMVPVRGGGLASVAGKVNVLLQSLISRSFVRNFALASEVMYVQQNAGRLCRAFFEIVLRKGWAEATNAFLNMSKCIEKKIWPQQSSLRQLQEYVKLQWIEKIENRGLSEAQLLDLEAKDLGYMFSCDGQKIYEALRMIPRLEVEATLKPITYTIVQVDATIRPAFNWNDRLLGKGGAQSFWLLLENANEDLIVYQERIAFNKVKVVKGEAQHLVFTIPMRDHQLTNQFQLRIASDYFLSDDTIIPLSMHNCILPKSFKAHTDLLPLTPLPVTTLRNPKFEAIYSFTHFNPIQTQVFHALYKTDVNALIGAPTGSGKTCCAELSMFRLLQDHPGKKCVYIAPLKALVRERVDDWKKKFEQGMGYRVIEVSGDFTPDAADLNAAPILITTPEKWDGISRSWATREYVRQVGLIVIDEIHLLGVDRGAVLEAIVTRLKMITRRSAVRESSARVVGLSTALANAGDVAEWLGIQEEGLYNFRPSVRPVPINVHIQGFPGQHYCPRMALMNKPAFKAILTYSPEKPVLVFVASRRQTRLTAMAFVSHLVSQADPKMWLHMDIMELEDIMQSIKDENLKLTLPFGIGMHHAGLSSHERAIVEQLYLDKKIQILIATATLAWGINMPAHLVIVKGTEYFDGKTCKYVDFPVTDVLQMMGRAGRPQFDTSAVAVIYVQDVKKNFYKKFLYEPFPVESSLLPVLANHVNAEINAGMISSKQGVMEYLAGTYFYRRLFANPNFYGLEDPSEQAMISFLVNVVDTNIEQLLASSCIVIDEEQGLIRSSPFGRLAAIYYLRHETIRFLLDNLAADNTIEDLLRILSHVPEYAEVPVRHNEDVVNTQLQRRLRIRFATNVMDSSHTKAHLLFQAHFARLEIPTDYKTDQKSVLDQCVRILQAMRDVCLLNGWLPTALLITTLQQMCHSARWHDDHPLLVLPYLKDHEAESFGEDATIPWLQDRLKVERANNVGEVQKAANRFFEKESTLDHYEINEIATALARWPIINVTAIRFTHGAKEISAPLFSNDGRAVRLEKNTAYRLKIDMESVGPSRFNAQAHLPRWAKEKKAGWIVSIGEKASNQLLSISHVPGVEGRRTARVDLHTPSKTGQHALTVFLYSDCYLGIDQEFTIPIELH